MTFTLIFKMAGFLQEAVAIRYCHVWLGSVPLEKRDAKLYKKFEPMLPQIVSCSATQIMAEQQEPHQRYDSIGSSENTIRLQPKIPDFLLGTVQIRDIPKVVL